VALVGPVPPWHGSIAQSVERLAEAFRKAGHDTFVATLRAQYPEHVPDWPGLRLLRYPGGAQRAPGVPLARPGVAPLLVPWSPASWRRTVRALAAFGPALLVFRWWMPAFGPAFAAVARGARRQGARVVAAVDNVTPHERWPLSGPLTRHALRAADGYVVHSDAVRRELLALLPDLDAGRVRLAPLPGFPLPAPGPGGRAGARARLGIDAPHVLLFFGIVRRYKGLDVLIAAMPALERALAGRIRLVVAGRFLEPVARFREQVRRLGLEGCVTLRPGWIPDAELSDLVAASDLVVQPCRSASQSGIVTVAHAQGRPVLATRVGGLPEMVRPGETGWLVPPEDPEALAGAVLHHLRSADAEAMERACRRAAERYRPEAQVEAMLELARGPGDTAG